MAELDIRAKELGIDLSTSFAGITFSNPIMTASGTFSARESGAFYDISELGRQAGHLIIYVESDTVTVEKAAEIMLDIKVIFDEARVPFAAMDFTLWYPKPEEGTRPDGDVSVVDFPYDAFYEAGMTDRVEEADKALKAYYAEQDAKYKN